MKRFLLLLSAFIMILSASIVFAEEDPDILHVTDERIMKICCR